LNINSWELMSYNPNIFELKKKQLKLDIHEQIQKINK